MNEFLIVFNDMHDVIDKAELVNESQKQERKQTMATVLV